MISPARQQTQNAPRDVPHVRRPLRQQFVAHAGKTARQIVRRLFPRERRRTSPIDQSVRPVDDFGIVQQFQMRLEHGGFVVARRSPCFFIYAGQLRLRFADGGGELFLFKIGRFAGLFDVENSVVQQHGDAESRSAGHARPRENAVFSAAGGFYGGDGRGRKGGGTGQIFAQSGFQQRNQRFHRVFGVGAVGEEPHAVAFAEIGAHHGDDAFCVCGFFVRPDFDRAGKSLCRACQNGGGTRVNPRRVFDFDFPRPRPNADRVRLRNGGVSDDFRRDDDVASGFDAPVFVHCHHGNAFHIRHDHRDQRIFTRAFKGGAVESDQRIAFFHLLPDGDLDVESGAFQRHCVQTDVHQDGHPRRRLNAQRVARRMNLRHDAVDRRAQDPRSRIDRHPVADRLSRKNGIRNGFDRHGFARHGGENFQKRVCGHRTSPVLKQRFIVFGKTRRVHTGKRLCRLSATGRIISARRKSVSPKSG